MSPVVKSEQLAAQLQERVAKELDSAWPSLQTPGIALAVVKEGQLTYFYGKGYADYDAHQPVTPETLFRVGSLTKTFTALAVNQLVHDGLVQLADDANKYLDGFTVGDEQDRWPPPSLHNLLTHSAGVIWPRSRIPGVTAPFGVVDSVAVRPGAQTPDLPEVCAPHVDTFCAPGSKYLYTNWGYGLLGHIVTVATGQPYEERVTDHILRPLGMLNSDWSPSEPASSAPRATGYRPDGTPEPNADVPFVAPACGALYSSAQDLARYSGFLAGDTPSDHVLPQALLRTMLTPALADAVAKTPYSIGLGWRLCRMAQHRIVMHGGSWPGYASEFWLAPDAHVGVALLANTEIKDERQLLFRGQLPKALLAHLLDAPVSTPLESEPLR